jgi:hypothetical protein
MAKVLLRAHAATHEEGYLRMVEATVGYFFSDVDGGHLTASSGDFQWVAQELLATGKYR